MIEKVFDTAETKLSIDIQRKLQEIIDSHKKRFVEETANEICNDLSTKLTIAERDEILASDEDLGKLVFKNPVTDQKELRFTTESADTVLAFQLAIARKIDEKAMLQLEMKN